MQKSNKNLLLVFLLCVLFVSCGNSKKKIVIGVSQCSEDIWRDKLNTELQIGTFLYDNVQLIFATANDDNKRQIQQINKFINDGIDLLIVAPNQMHSVSSAINRAYEKGIPVIVFDRKTDTDKYTAFIGADNYFIGQTMARFIATQLGEHGNVVELKGLDGSSPAIERHRGFVDELKKYPDIKIVDSRYTDWTKQSGKLTMDTVLMNTQNIDCVFGHNDRIAEGAKEAVKEVGFNKDIIFTGIDALPTQSGGMQLVKDGSFAASYIYPTRGDLVIQLAMNILENKPYQRDNYLQSAIITKDNVDAMLLEADEMIIQQEKLIKLHEEVDLYLAQYNHQKIYQILLAIIIFLLIGFLLYVYRTITLKRAMTEQTMNAKLQFFTNVSHEFRTPLTLIADPVNRLLSSKSLNKEQHDLLSLIQRNVGVMLKLTNEILDFRKVQNGKMTIQVTDFDLADNIRTWTESFLPSAEKRKTTINLDVPNRLTVHSDHYKIERIFYNLLSNALKYAGENGNIRIILKEITDNKFCLEISDNGIGMPEETLAKVFDRFYQVKGSKNGTGIGLALVKAFSELLGGNVTVSSKQGVGSTFSVTLPINIDGQLEENCISVISTDVIEQPSLDDISLSEDNGNKKLERVTDPDENAEKPHVLVIDDNTDVLNYICSILAKHYETSTATDGKAGLERAIKEVPDLIISDVMMPIMDGLEMCENLKKEIATSHIPVILLTAKSGEDYRAEGYDCGADAYITKPFSSKVLLARIKNLLENRKLLKDYFSNNEQEETRPKDTDSIFLDNLKEKIVANLANSDFNVEDLGTEMGLSRVQLYRKVKAITGSSPVELIRISRLKRAKQMLTSGNKTISEVCYAVGFSSPSYFTKCYKEFYGHTPTETA